MSRYASLFASLFAGDVTRSHSDTTPPPAHFGGAPKRNSLRYLPPPGLAGWSALPERDRRLLEWLLVGEYLTSELAQTLAYPSLRVAQRRLARLRADGLLAGGWAANMQRTRGRYAYRLSDESRRGLEALVWGERPLRSFASGGASTVIHHLAVHDLLQAMLRAAGPRLGLVAWLPQRVAAALFEGYLRPDAVAAVRIGDGLVLFFLELDTGSERPPVLGAKLRRYRAVLAPRAEVAPAHLLFVVSSLRRLRVLQSSLASITPRASEPTAWLALSSDLVRAPWSAALWPLDGRPQFVPDLAAHASDRSLELARRGCLLEPEQAEIIDERALGRLQMLDHYRRRSGL